MNRIAICVSALLACLGSNPSLAAVSAETDAVAPKRALVSLVPEIAEHPYHLAPGVRPFAHRLAVSPGFGFFGSEKLYTMRAMYNPDSWLGYEAALGHNPGQSVHAVLHSFSFVVRHPFQGRLQPYLTGGYGMVLVFPGRSVNAKPVTKNALTAGGGLEWFLRDDLAIRGDLRHATVFGQQRDREGLVAFDYLQGTVGLSFHRMIQP